MRSRIAAGEADLLIGCDIVVAASPTRSRELRKGKTRAVVNSTRRVTGAFTRNPDFDFPGGDLRRQIVEATGAERRDFVEATRLATALLGDAIATNLFMLGFAYQQGAGAGLGAPRSTARSSSTASPSPSTARRSSGAAARLTAAATSSAKPRPRRRRSRPMSQTLDEIVARRAGVPHAYQNAAYAARYAKLVRACRGRRARQS